MRDPGEQSAVGNLIGGQCKRIVVSPRPVDVQVPLSHPFESETELFDHPVAGLIIWDDVDLHPMQTGSGEQKVSRHGDSTRHQGSASHPLIDPVADTGILGCSARHRGDHELTDDPCRSIRRSIRTPPAHQPRKSVAPASFPVQIAHHLSKRPRRFPAPGSGGIPRGQPISIMGTHRFPFQTVGDPKRTQHQILVFQRDRPLLTHILEDMRNDATGRDDKAEFRALMRTRRREMTRRQRTEESAALTDQALQLLTEQKAQPIQQIASVVSYGAEPDTTELHTRLHTRGVGVLVPVNLPGRQLGWVRWYPGVPMERSVYAPIDEPVGTRHGVEIMAEVDVVFVPAQAADPRGYRMGQGGGYYDRFLAALDASVANGDMARAPLTVAVVFSHEFLDVGDIPVNDFDRPADAVLTPEGLHWSVP